MADGIEIREIAPEDVPGIIEIHRLIMKGEFSMSWIKSIELDLQRKDVAGYVALKNGRVAGFIAGEICGPSFGLEKSGWIIGIGVHPHFMGTGIGKVLAERILQYFREEEVRDIYTAVRWNRVDMLSFFISVGLGRTEFINLKKHLDDASSV
jgi:ribosomal protein S18 acetylase RimI-like enzyme